MNEREKNLIRFMFQVKLLQQFPLLASTLKLQNIRIFHSLFGVSFYRKFNKLYSKFISKVNQNATSVYRHCKKYFFAMIPLRICTHKIVHLLLHIVLNTSLIIHYLDVGGQDKIRPLWRHYFQNTQVSYLNNFAFYFYLTLITFLGAHFCR